jgi:hypothetical protein
VLAAGGLRVIVDARGPPGAEDQGGDVVPLCGQFVYRQLDRCVCFGGNCQEGGSLVDFVAHKTHSLDAHDRTDFVNHRVKDLFGRHAPGEERGYATKRGLLGLDLGEMRISSSAIR